MKRLMIGIAVLLIAGAGGGIAMRQLVDAGPIYSVSQLDAVLRSHPAAVIGHVVLVRGAVGFCPIRIGCPPNIPPIMSERLGQPSPDPPLQLGYGPDQSLLASLRGLPVLGALIPPRPPLEDGYQGIVRVRIEPVSPAACFERLCFEGVLQDKARPIVSD